MHFGTITTLLACTARSTVPRQRNAPVQNPLLLLRLINTLGSSIAVGCFRHRSPPDCEFAPHRVPDMPDCCITGVVVWRISCFTFCSQSRRRCQRAVLG